MLRYAHGSGAPLEGIVDDRALEHSEAIASNRSVSKELIASIYSIVAHGCVQLLSPRGLGVTDEIPDPRNASASGRAAAKEMLKSIYSILGEKRGGWERHNAQLMGAGDDEYSGFKVGQVVYWARRDKAFGQRGKIVGYTFISKSHQCWSRSVACSTIAEYTTLLMKILKLGAKHELWHERLEGCVRRSGVNLQRLTLAATRKLLRPMRMMLTRRRMLSPPLLMGGITVARRGFRGCSGRSVDVCGAQRGGLCSKPTLKV